MGRFLFAICAVAICFRAAEAQRVSDSTQRTLERLAATYADSLKPWWADFTGFAFDSFGYVDAVPQLEAHPNPSLEVLASHDSAHVAAIASRLRIGATLEASGRCWPLSPDGCRMGSHAGVAAFSPAEDADGIVTLTLLRFQRSASGTRTSMLFTAITFTAVIFDGQWRIAKVTVGSGQDDAMGLDPAFAGVTIQALSRG